MTERPRFFWILFCCALPPRLILGAYSTQPLRIADPLEMTAFVNRSPIALSPDTQLVAFTLQRPQGDNTLSDERYRYYTSTGVPQESAGSDIWVTDIRSTQSRNLTGEKGSSWGPVWSPDGKWLAFYSDRNGAAHLWVWERATGKIRQVSHAIARPFFGFEVVRWAPDSRTILAKVLPENTSLEEAADLILGRSTKTNSNHHTENAATVTVFGSPPPKESSRVGVRTVVESQSWTNRNLADLALIDVGNGKVRRIAKSVKPRGYWFSPDGRLVAFMNLKGLEPNTQQVLYDLMIQSPGATEPRVLVPNIQQDYGISVSWSPDGRKLAYTMNKSRGQADCFVVSVETGETRDLTPPPHPAFDAHYGAPFWDSASQLLYLVANSSLAVIGRPGSDTLWRASLKDGSFSVLTTIPDHEVLGIASSYSAGRFWVPDGGRFLVMITRNDVTKQEGFYKADLATGRVTKLYEDSVHFAGPGVNFGIDQSPDGRTFTYLCQDAQHPDDIWITDAEFRQRRRLTHTNPRLENIAFGTSRMIAWNSADGQPLRGGLLLPAGYREGKRYPLVVFVYGGSFQSDNLNHFGVWGGIFNLQILAARGYAILLPDTPLRRGTPMQDLIRGVMPGIDKVVELGIADPARLGVMGQSYGGYSTLALIVQTRRFKAAVDCDGLADLVSYYGTMSSDGTAPGAGYLETGQGNMEGTPWQYRDRYIANSPIFFLDQVQTPLLIIQGELDPAVPHTQAEEVFVGLRRLGKEVVYARYAGEEHVVGGRRLANGVDMWNRIITWFDDHLKRSEAKKQTGASL